MQEKSSSRQSEPPIFVFDDAILVMSTNDAKCYLLVLPIDLIQKTFMCERAVVGMIMLDGAVGLSHDLFESLDHQNCLVHRVILHEVDVNKVTNMITKCSATPNAAT